MRAIFRIAGLCTAAGGLALLALSAVTVAPPARAGFASIQCAAAVVTAAWVVLLFWAGARLRAGAGVTVSLRVRRCVLAGAVVWLALLFVGVLG